MRNFLALAVLALFALSFRPCVLAQEEAPKITDERPFLAQAPAVIDVEALLTKAGAGDEEALATLKSSGLTYAGYLAISPVPALEEIGYKLMRDHIDWIKAMHGWEVALLRPDPPAVLREYQRLKPRFYSAEASLARALMHAKTCGDDETCGKLAALAPDSTWVKAVKAHFLDGMDSRAAAETLIEMVAAIGNLDRAYLFLEPSKLGFAKPGRSRLEKLRGEFALAKTPEVLREIAHVPSQWQMQRLFERIGGLLGNVDDAEFKEQAINRVREIIKGRTDAAMHETALVIPAKLETAGVPRNITPTNWRQMAAFSAGPMFVGYAHSTLDARQPEARALGAAVCGMAAPELALCQRFCLTTLNSWHDDLLALLALRSALALRDDDLATYSHVARALMRAKRFDAQAALFRKALVASKHEALLKLAGVMEKGAWTDLNDHVGGALNLSLAQRVSLLEPFTFPEELAAHGGPEAVYWLNRAAFLDASRAVWAAARCHWQALAICLKTWQKDHHPNLAEYALFLRRNCDAEVRTSLANAMEKFDKPLAARVLPWVAHFEEDNDADKQPLASSLKEMLTPGNLLSDAVASKLAANPDMFGGVGLACAARDALLSKRYLVRVELREKAERTSPVCLWTHLLQGPLKENTGTSMLANWELVSRVILRVVLLQPFSAHSRAWSMSIAARTGQAPYAAALSALVAYSRPATRMLGSMNETENVFMPAQSRYPMRALLKECLYSADLLDARAFRMAVETLTQMSFGSEGWDGCMVASHASARLEWGHCALEEFMSVYNMSDVNNLLNGAFGAAHSDPEIAIALVEKADQIGVSRYGRFVGTQAMVEAHGQLGTLEKTLDRYHDIRAGKVGNPPVLDTFMLSGVLYGNNHKQLKDAMEAIAKYEHDPDDWPYMFLHRRALMALGRHSELLDLPLPQAPRHPSYMGGDSYSELFHEARMLLDEEDYSAILSRCEPYLTLRVEDGLGVYVDAAVMRAIALKASGGEYWADKETKKAFNVLHPGIVAYFDSGSRFLDSAVLEMLCGKKPAGALAPWDDQHGWHGSVFGERTAGHVGSGIINEHEIKARDKFIRGVLAWLAGDNEAARVALNACLAAEAKCSYEYHVAQWLLEKKLKP